MEPHNIPFHSEIHLEEGLGLVLCHVMHNFKNSYMFILAGSSIREINSLGCLKSVLFDSMERKNINHNRSPCGVCCDFLMMFFFVLRILDFT